MSFFSARLGINLHHCSLSVDLRIEIDSLYGMAMNCFILVHACNSPYFNTRLKCIHKLFFSPDVCVGLAIQMTQKNNFEY